ncbi:type IV secretory system conjugative DNA transfer family protein [Achromobacter sp. DH1f]|uniref:type IV secretory system conjugative DNA transfer family protein n=1 Tax=Achromobacter sp. DH1f TaxID=1397275 RepID=UPI00046843F6|nr:type IV secretory system conjugative DNA transfer family protein [Achromobacter sp. DH1f]
MQAKQQGARNSGISRLLLATAIAVAFGGAPACALAQQSEALNSLMNAKAGNVAPRISPVREAILRPTAQALGTQTGMIEAANEILQVINDMGGTMDRTFRFGDLVMGQGVLPPVVVASHNTASLGESGKTMRVAGSVYKIEEPARFFTGAPSWRDWLLMGLLAQADAPALPTNPQLLPQDDKERAYWQDIIQKSYLQGREQAKRIFEENLAGLERTYLGMRTFYELHGRGLVSLPRLATSQDVVNQTDPNTIIVGDTVFRITVPSSFNTDTGRWKPTAGSAPTPAIPAQSTNLANPAFKPYVPAQRVEPQAQRPGVMDAQASAPGAVQTAPVAAPLPATQPTQPAADSAWSGAPQSAAPAAGQVIRIRIGQDGGVTDASAYAPRPAPSVATVQPGHARLGSVAFNVELPAMLAVRPGQVWAERPAVISPDAPGLQPQAVAVAQPSTPPLPAVRSAPAVQAPPSQLSAEEIARLRAEIYAKAYADEFQRTFAAQAATQSTPIAPVGRGAAPRVPPVVHVPPAPAQAFSDDTYEVRGGDTAYSLAARFGVSWQSLLETNGLLTPAEVRPGLRLRIATNRG